MVLSYSKYTCISIVRIIGRILILITFPSLICISVFYIKIFFFFEENMNRDTTTQIKLFNLLRKNKLIKNGRYCIRSNQKINKSGFNFYTNQIYKNQIR